MQFFSQIVDVEEKLGIVFQEKKLLFQAFIHRSFWNEHQNVIPGHNERLEFLGDSVLGLVVSEYLFLNHPDLDEGVLSTLRSQLVDAPACAHYVQKLSIEEYLLLGKGEKMNRGKGRDSILADLFEALMGAIYVDQGLTKVREFYFTHFMSDIEKLITHPQPNWKAELQDYAQKKFQEPPIYEVIEESGPAHQKKFRVSVAIKGEVLGEGEGSSKKEAQTLAAQDAILKISRESA